MPYKDGEQAKEASKERMKRYREKMLHPVTPVENVTPDVTPLASGGNVTPLKVDVTPVKSEAVTPQNTGEMLTIPSRTLTTKQLAKLSMIIKAMDKQVSGLHGKRENLLGMVRYGVNGKTLAELKQDIEDKANYITVRFL